MKPVKRVLAKLRVGTCIVVITILLFLAVDRASYLFLPAEPVMLVDPAIPTMQLDANLGYRPEANLRQRNRKVIDGKMAYDVIYSTDSDGRRTAPPNPGAQKFLAVFGCSFVFGLGLNDTETLPTQLAPFFPGFQVYNYGAPGYGPHQMLALLESARLRNEIPQTRGLGLYVYMDKHIERAIGSGYIVTRWGKNAPYYVRNLDEKFERRGNFTTGRPFWSLFYRWAAKSNLLYHLAFGHEVQTNKNQEFVAQMIGAARDEFQKQYPESPFYAVIYPGTTYAEEMQRNLQRLAIPTLNYASLFSLDSPDYSIPLDRHPTGKANHVLAATLALDLAARLAPPLKDRLP